MVSRFQRHLSLFLVVVLAMGWLVVPVGARGQVDLTKNVPIPTEVQEIEETGLTVADFSASLATNAGSKESLDVAPDRWKLHNGYQFAYINNPANPTSVQFSWNQPNEDSLIDKEKNSAYGTWKYLTKYKIQYTLVNDAPSGITGTLCQSNTVWKDLAVVDENNDQKLRTVRTIDDARSKIGGPAYFRLLAYAEPGGILNAAQPLSCGLIPISNDLSKIGDAAGGVPESFGDNRAGLSKAGGTVQTIFGKIKNDTKTSLSARTGDLDLRDFRPDQAQPLSESNKVDETKAPQVVINHSAIFTQDDLVGTLWRDVRSPEYFKARENNYFFFRFDKPTDDQKLVFSNKGLADLSVVYLVIDMMGNVGFLVDDTSKKGGIFATGKDRFDVGDTNFIAIGNFNGERNGQSHNTVGGPLNINLVQNRDVITSRVYNDPDVSAYDTAWGVTLGAIKTYFTSIDNVHCGNVVDYPEHNTGYGKIGPIINDDKMPWGGYRKCINVGPNGWLNKWGVEDFRIDQSPADDCSKSFGSGFFNKIAGGVICGILNTMISGATWMAGFSIEFLVQSIGLQTGS